MAEVVVNGVEHRTGKTINVTSPQHHQHKLATVHQAPAALLQDAIDGATEAQKDCRSTGPSPIAPPSS